MHGVEVGQDRQLRVVELVVEGLAQLTRRVVIGLAGQDLTIEIGEAVRASCNSTQTALVSEAAALEHPVGYKQIKLLSKV